MLEPVIAPSDTADAVPDHDHAWRRTTRGSGRPTLLGEYLCDLCPATWSM
jgi:hypothetical protein